MAQETFGDWDAISSNNITITGDAAAIDIDEGMLAGLVNNALRSIMSGAVVSWGGMHSGTSRPAAVQTNRFWLNTTTAAAPIITWYDGTDDIVFATMNATTNVITIDSSVVFAGVGLANVVEDTTPQLGGNLDVNGNTITSASAGDVTLDPDTTGTIILGAATVTIETDITHAGDTDNKFTFGTDTQDFQTGGTSRLDISDSGVRLGAANARVTTVLDEDAMGTDSATALATQQSIKAYVDAQGSGAFGSALLHVRDEQTSGTDGGTATTGSWEPRVLNTTLTNEITGASLVSNEFILPVGEYWIEAGAVGKEINDHKARIYNVTDAAEELVGFNLNATTDDTAQNANIATVSGRMTVATSSKTYRIEHQVGRTQASDGHGGAATFGSAEVYAEAKIWKVA